MYSYIIYRSKKENIQNNAHTAVHVKKRVLIQASSLQFLGQSPGPLSELIHGQLLYIFLSDVLCLRANILYFLQSTKSITET